MIRLILTTGGTGGHIFPALAVASAVSRLVPEAEILFVGGSGPEGELAIKHGLSFKALPAKGIFGRGLRVLREFPWLFKAYSGSLKILREFKPDVVVGFGGYAGFFPVLTASLLRIPTLIHEQNSVPGVANRILSRFAKMALLSYPDLLGRLPKTKCRLVGLPVRKDIADLLGKSTRTPGRNLLVLGGSQGAKIINAAMMQAGSKLFSQGIMVRHQVGKTEFERVKSFYADNKFENITACDFIENMAENLSWADLILSRAGASVLAEVACAGKPSILVPFAQATHNHQMHNAVSFRENGATVILPENELSGKILANLVMELLNDPLRMHLMGEAAAKIAMPNAADVIAGYILKLARKTEDKTETTKVDA